MSRRIFITFLCLITLLSLAGGVGLVWAETMGVGGSKEDIEVLNKEIAARKDKIKQLEDTIAQYRSNIEKKQNEAVSLRNQMSILDNRTAQIQADIELTEEKIKEAQLQVDALLITIKEKEKSMDKQKTIIAKIVQNIHANDQKNYFEILLSYDDFSEFFNELKYTESIYIDLGRSVRALRIVREELNDKKLQVEAKKKVYQDLKNELEDKKFTLRNQITTKQNLLIQTKSSELKYQALLSSLKQQYQVIEGEVRTFEDQVRKKLEQQDKIQEGGSTDFNWPTPSHYITSVFHDPDYPYRRVFEHSGMDIKAAQGTAIRAAASGYVARAKRCTAASCYSYVLLVHTGNLSSLYGHMSNIIIGDDAFVNKGDIIGYSGGTPGTVGAGPFVTGPHLHFEIRLNGIPVNPDPYLP